MLIRLQKHIADLGICSRRKAEELIALGKVKVNGKMIREMGVKVDPEKDLVTVEGHDSKSLKSDSRSPIYIALNKPVDYITSTSDEQGQSIMSLLKKENAVGYEKRQITERVYPVGRLDKDSEGLVLLTNDGDLTQKLTHPSFEHEKEYEVTIGKPLTKEAKKILTKGMFIDEAKKEYVRGITIKKEFNKGRQTIITVILKEGKNRQIRRMFGVLGYKVQVLRRTRIGKLKLNVLGVGRWKFVKRGQIV